MPAKMSPSRLPCSEISEQISAGAPQSIQNSRTPASPRNRACRNRSGPPSSLTTRSPSASLPRLRPRVQRLEDHRVADEHEHRRARSTRPRQRRVGDRPGRRPGQEGAEQDGTIWTAMSMSSAAARDGQLGHPDLDDDGVAGHDI